MKATTIICLLFLTTVSFGQAKKVSHKPYTCVAGPNEVCPSDLWVKDFYRLRDLQNKWTPPQDTTDLMNGMIQRLSKEVPAGYTWNDEKLRFVKVTQDAPKPAPAPTPAPTPAPAATEKK